MKQICKIIVFSWVFLVLAAPAVEGNNGLGIGVIIGEPTGISLKLWNSRTTAIDAAAAWSFRKEGKLHLHMDYLFHNFKLFKVSPGKLPLYYGIGCRVKFEEETRVGVRFPVGICCILKEIPIDIFFEIVPLLDLTPETDFNFNASIGVRYFFRQIFVHWKFYFACREKSPRIIRISRKKFNNSC